eukprot:344129_1
MASFGDSFNSNNNNTKHSNNTFSINETVHHHYYNEATSEEKNSNSINDQMKPTPIKMDKKYAIRLNQRNKLKTEIKLKKETLKKEEKIFKKEPRIKIDEDLTSSEDEDKEVIFQGFKKKNRNNKGDVICTGYKRNKTKVKYEMK